MANLTNLQNNQNISIKNYITLGRASRCSLTLKDRKLSRIHCEIIRFEESFILVDLQSQNGTKVNEKNVYEAILKNKDIIEIGKTKLIFGL